MEGQVESREAQGGLAVEVETFSDLCAVISKEIDRVDSSHQTFIRFLESILYDIKNETLKIESKNNEQIQNMDEFEKEIMGMAIVKYLPEIKDMVQIAVTKILLEDSGFKKKLEKVWLPQIKKIFLEALRVALKNNVEYKDKKEEKWFLPLIAFIFEPCVEEELLSPEMDAHRTIEAPSSPKETNLSPKKPEQRERKVSFDLHYGPQKGGSLPVVSQHGYPLAKKRADTSKTELKGEVNSAEISRRDRNSSNDSKKPLKGNSAVVVHSAASAAPPPSPVIAEKNQARGKGLPESKKKLSRASLPVRISNFFQWNNKGPKDDDDLGPAAGSSQSL